MLYVAAAPDRRLAQLEAHLARLKAELSEVNPQYNELDAEQREARKAQQAAEKAADAARAYLGEGIAGADEAFAEATTHLNDCQAVYRDITKGIEQAGERINAIHTSMSTIYAAIAAKEASAAKGALLVLLLCLATALPHGS